MPHELTEFPPEPEPQPAASRGRKPPGKGVGVLDFVPPEPGAGPPNLRDVSIPTWLFILLVLIAIGAALWIHYVP